MKLLDKIKKYISKIIGLDEETILYLCSGESLPVTLSDEEEKAYIEKLDNNDEFAKQKLIEHNLRLVVYVAKKLGISEAKAYGVATFYENFSFEPKGKYVIKVCDGTACHVRKSTGILERIRADLGLNKEKHTTDDMLFTLETVSCLGACGLAPVVMVNETVYPSMTPEAASELLVKLREEA